MMTKGINEYLKSLALSSVLTERVKSVHKFYESLVPQPITDAFISEYVKEDGERVWESLWFFSRDYAMEADSFASQDFFDFVWLGQMERIVFRKTEYDFEKATSKSRLTINASIVGDLTIDLKASAANCDALKRIAITYLVPRVTPRTATGAVSTKTTSRLK